MRGHGARSKRAFRQIVVLVVAVAASASGLAGCASGPADRRALCTEFDQLGRNLFTSVGGFTDNAVFSSAGDLADVAGRYQGGANLSADAEALQSIADSDSTSSRELTQATRGTAAVCGHPLGLGTTTYSDTGTGTGGDSGGTNSGSGAYAGHDGYTSTYTAPAPYTPTTAPTTMPTTTTSSAPSGEESAQAALQGQVDTDRTSAEALADRWIPQLSSKNYGLVADGTTYDYEAIWADFTTTRQSYPAALLLWSGDYTSFTKGDFWVTVVNTSFSSGAEANAWCAAQHLDADHCFGKLVSHSHGPRGSTLPR
jgi:hypothetical protein